MKVRNTPTTVFSKDSSRYSLTLLEEPPVTFSRHGGVKDEIKKTEGQGRIVTVSQSRDMCDKVSHRSVNIIKVKDTVASRSRAR